MASISEMLEDAKASVKQMEKKHNFKKANKDREAAAQLQYDLGLCRAKLERCKKEFNSTIREQSRNITRGRNEGLEIRVQEQILKDAAIGYLLVREAIFALQSVNNYDTVEHAYELLDAAVRQMSGKKEKRKWGFGRSGERAPYEYLTSDEMLKSYQTKIEPALEELKQTGDIEAWLKTAGNSDNSQASASGRSEVDRDMERLRQASGTADDDDDIDEDLLSSNDVRAPEAD